MAKTVESAKSALSMREMESRLASHKCGHIGRTKLEQEVGLPLPVIERRVKTVRLAFILERR